MKNLRLLSTYIFNLVYIIFIEESTGLSGPMCDITQYPLPYVKVLRKRNGPHIESLDRSGFMDLTKYIHRILCMNGPAVVYGDVRFDGSNNEIKVFTKGNLSVHQHNCIIINQISTEKAIELRDAGNDNPTLMDVEGEDIIGPRVTGIYLVSEKDDYFMSTSVMFRQRDLDYIITGTDSVEDGSFVTLGKGPFCITVMKKFDIILSGQGLEDDSLCKWTYKDTLAIATAAFTRRYEKIFDGTYHRQDFTWRDCGGGGGGGDGLGPYPNGLTTPAPNSGFIKYDPFAIIDPKFWTAKGSVMKFMKSKKGVLGTFERGNKTNLVTDEAADGADDYDEAMPGDFHIEMDIKMCKKLPKKVTVKPAECQDADEKAPCEILQKAAMSPQEKPDDSRDLLEKLAWKKEVLDVTSEIFGKICEPFAPEMPFTIARVIEYYLARSHKANTNFRQEKQDVWDFLMSELRRCNHGIKKPLLWYWDNREDLPSPDPGNGPMDCKVDTCSDGCKKSSDEKTCEPVDDCKTATPICDSACKLDEDTMECTAINPGTPEGSACPASTTPTCAPESCMFDSDSSKCIVPTCEATACNDAACNMVRDTCEDATTNSIGGGANPSDAGDFDSVNDGGQGGTVGSTPMQTPSAPPPVTFEKAQIQEIIRPRSPRMYNFNGYPINVLVITNIVKKLAKGRSIKTNVNENTTVVGECLFFYEDMAETDFELNIAIDIHWKIWATVIGYCNNFYQLRKSETFPRLYNTYYEDFFEPLVEDWKYPKENDALRLILSEFNSEKSQRWLDVCLESSYYVSNSSTYRPPRPLTVGNEETLQSNYFLQIPDFIAAKYHTINVDNPDETVKCA